MPIQAPAVRVDVPRINVQHIQVTLIGDSPLISHRWSEKAKKEMLEKQMKVAKTAKAAKDRQVARGSNSRRCEEETILTNWGWYIHS